MINALAGGEDRVGDCLAVSAGETVYGALNVESIATRPGVTSRLLCRSILFPWMCCTQPARNLTPGVRPRLFAPLGHVDAGFPLSQS